MTEFSSRVEAQRKILKTVNNGPWKEQLFALNSNAISRWALENGVEGSARIVNLLKSASDEIFAMANHSDDPIAGSYRITKERVSALEAQIRSELGGQPCQDVGDVGSPASEGGQSQLR